MSADLRWTLALALVGWWCLSALAQLPLPSLWRWLHRWDRAALVPSYWFFAPQRLGAEVWVEVRPAGASRWTPLLPAIPRGPLGWLFAPDLRAQQQLRDACVQLLRATDARSREDLADALATFAQRALGTPRVDLRLVRSSLDEPLAVVFQRLAEPSP